MTFSCLHTCSTSVFSSSSGGRLGSRTITTISPGIQLKIVLGSPIISMALRDIHFSPLQDDAVLKYMRFCLFLCRQNGPLPKVSVYGIIADGAIRNNVQLFNRCAEKGLLRGRHRQTRRGGRGVEGGGDACVALAGGGRLVGPGRGRRKRPLPTHHPPPPLRVRSRFSSLLVTFEDVP